MAQHVLLLAVVPPLILLGRPWSTGWRAFPIGLRRAAAPTVARLRAPSPGVATVLFVGTMAAWHVPTLFDATLSSTVVHLLEHGTFLASGLLFWSHQVDSPPVRSRLAYPARALHATVGMAAGWVLAIVLALAAEPLYDGYARLAERPGGISALADQQLAAGIMWVPGSIPFTVAILVFVVRWLDAPRPVARVVEGR
jgi:cytochrome c oxidase assembly factor CtaG